MLFVIFTNFILFIYSVMIIPISWLVLIMLVLFLAAKPILIAQGNLTKHDSLGHPKTWQKWSQLPRSLIARGIFPFHDDLIILFFLAKTEIINKFLFVKKAILNLDFIKYLAQMQHKLFQETLFPIVLRIFNKIQYSFWGNIFLKIITNKQFKILSNSLQIILLVNIVMNLTADLGAFFSDLFLQTHTLLLILRIVLLIITILLLSENSYKFLIFELYFWYFNLNHNSLPQIQRDKIENWVLVLWHCFYFEFRLWSARIHFLALLVKLFFFYT